MDEQQQADLLAQARKLAPAIDRLADRMEERLADLRKFARGLEEDSARVSRADRSIDTVFYDLKDIVGEFGHLAKDDDDE